MKQKILIVDDEQPIVTLLAFNLEKEGFATDCAYDGEEAVRMVKKYPYDFMILDLMLPRLDGLEVCKQLRQQQINIPILMLTAKDSEIDKIIGLELGADDYLTKPFSPREIITRVKVILRRSGQLNKGSLQIIKVGELSIFPEKFEVQAGGRKIQCTGKEFELLHYLAINEGIVLERDRLLNEIWGYNFSSDSRIVDVHMSRLRAKLTGYNYIQTVHGLGYKMDAKSS